MEKTSNEKDLRGPRRMFVGYTAFGIWIDISPVFEYVTSFVGDGLFHDPVIHPKIHQTSRLYFNSCFVRE